MNGHSDGDDDMVNGDAKNTLDMLTTPKPLSALPRIPKKKKEEPEVKKEEPDDDDLIKRLQALQDEGASASDAARQLAQCTGLSRRRLYALLHQGTSN